MRIGAAGTVLDANAPESDVVDHVFFLGIEGGFTFGGLGGFNIRFALSELGPLTAQVTISVPGGIILEPNTGLAINDFTGLLEQIPAEQWSTPTDLEGWDVHAVASHIAHLEAILAGGSEETVEVGEPTAKGTQLDVVVAEV